MSKTPICYSKGLVQHEMCLEEIILCGNNFVLKFTFFYCLVKRSSLDMQSCRRNMHFLQLHSCYVIPSKEKKIIDIIFFFCFYMLNFNYGPKRVKMIRQKNPQKLPQTFSFISTLEKYLYFRNCCKIAYLCENNYQLQICKGKLVTDELSHHFTKFFPLSWSNRLPL